MMKKFFKRFTAIPKSSKVIVLAGVFVVVMAAGFGVAQLLAKKPVDTVASAPAAPEAPQKGTPTYQTALPKGRTIESLGGWTRVSPPDRDPVYAYVDTIGTTKVIVSQQALPADFKADPDAKTRELAQSYNAKTELPVGSVTVFTGESTGGVESVIFHLDDLLVLIKADTSIDQAALKEYVGSLS